MWDPTHIMYQIGLLLSKGSIFNKPQGKGKFFVCGTQAPSRFEDESAGSVLAKKFTFALGLRQVDSLTKPRKTIE